VKTSNPTQETVVLPTLNRLSVKGEGKGNNGKRKEEEEDI
jgi:hypothetical protein